jgi:hypothetical protein
MILSNGKYLCVLCGEEIDITSEQRPLTLIKASSGKPNLRVIMLGGEELHACRPDPAREKRAGRGSGEP